MDWRVILAITCLIASTVPTTATDATTNPATATPSSMTEMSSAPSTSPASPASAGSSTPGTSPASPASAGSSTPGTSPASPASAGSSTPGTSPASPASAGSSTPGTSPASPASAGSSTPGTSPASPASAGSSTPGSSSVTPTTAGSSTPGTSSTPAITILTSTPSTIPATLPTTLTSTAAPVATIFTLTFSINEVFVPALANTNSAEFKAKAASVINQVERLYKVFKNFLRMEILKFKSGSIVTESKLLFSSDGPAVNVADVTSTFSGGLNQLNFSVDPNSISSTQNSVNIVAVFFLTFSINETFSSDLANPTSATFLNKSSNISTEVGQLYSSNFATFIRMQILALRNGSIVTDSSLSFSSNINATQVKNTLLNGLGSLSFTIDPNSIKITQLVGNSMSPVIASSLSMILMSLLSLLLSGALHF